MRKIIVLTSLAMIMSTALISLTRGIEGRASASNANPPLSAQERATVSISDASLTEGDAGTSNMVFIVTVTGHSNFVGVDYSTENGSATAPSDYISTSDQLIFPPGGDVTMSITVPIVGDTTPESVETVFVNLSIVDFSGDLADGQGVGTINDTDVAPTLPALSISDVSVNEGDTGTVNAVFAVSLSGASSSDVTVSYATADGTATILDDDYTSRSGSVTFPAGDTSQRLISIPVTGDIRAESDETFLVNLASPAGATIADGQGVGTIVDDEGESQLPVLSITDVSVFEGNGNEGRIAVFVLNLSAPSSSPVTLDYETRDRDASYLDDDYIRQLGTLTFSPNSTSQTISVPVVGDTKQEPSEYFLVALRNVQGAIALRSIAVGTIIDDDGGPLPFLGFSNAVGFTEGNTGTREAEYHLSLIGGTTSTVTVNYETVDGSASVADNDYVSRSGVVTFLPGDISPKSIFVPIVGDTRTELDEFFFIELSNPLGATADDIASCRIVNDDAPCSYSISPLSAVFPAPGGAGSVDVMTAEGCHWYAVNSYGFAGITITDGSGTGPGAFHYTVSPLRFATEASGIIDVYSGVRNERDNFFLQRIMVEQFAQTTCQTRVDARNATRDFPARGGLGSVSVDHLAGCRLHMRSDVPWISVSDLAIVDGSENRTYRVAPNGEENPRIGTIAFGTVDGADFDVEASFTVSQRSRLNLPPCVEALSPEVVTLGERYFSTGLPASLTVNVKAPDDCLWEPFSPKPWVRITSVNSSFEESSGSGDGSFSYVVGDSPFGTRDDSTARITVGGKEHTICVLTEICDDLHSNSAICGDLTLSQSRSFRDQVLAKTPRGQRYTQLYYKFSTEALGIMMLNPMLILRSREMMQRYMPVVQSMVRGEQVTLTEGDIEEIDRFLRSVADKGSPELQLTVKGLCDDLRDAQVLRDFNITLSQGKKRGLPAQSKLISSAGIGMMLPPLGLLLFFYCSKKSARRMRLKTALESLCESPMFRSTVFKRTTHSASIKGGTRKSLTRSLKRPTNLAIVFLIISSQYPLGIARAAADGGQRAINTGQLAVVGGQSNLPLNFEVNRGQLDPQVKFISRGSGYGIYLTSTAAVIALGTQKAKGKGKELEQLPLTVGDQRLTTDVLRLKLINANPSPRIRGLVQTAGYANYFVGGDAAKWRAGVPTYSGVKYEDVYPGVDMLYYGKEGALEYDFIVAPRADLGQIRVGFEGADKIDIDSKGDLVLHVGGREIRQPKPVIYQEVDGIRHVVAGRYVLYDDENLRTQHSEPRTPSRDSLLGVYTVEVSPYDLSKPLVIDPVLAYSTYFGGSGNEEGNSIAVDSAGNLFVTGFTDSINFPVANGSQPVIGGQQDAFVAKLDPSGTRFLYSTYIGGNGQDNGTSIAVDSAGNAYITGFTDSANFPVRNALQQTNKGSFNAFIVKLDAAGSMLNSTLFGGSINDYGSSIAVDSAGNVYVAGLATSPDVPTTNALQSKHGGLVDLYVAKIDPSGARLVYSTYLGGGGIEGASSIAVDSAGNVYLTGLTSSRNLRTVNPLQATHGGGVFDAFVTKLNPSGSQIIYSTYLGGSGEDRAFRIAVDSAGSAYVTGDTDSTDFPITNGSQPHNRGSSDAFVAKLTPSGSALVYSTYLGGRGIEGGTAIAVDSAGSAYVTGFTGSNDFPTTASLQAFGGGGFDGFVAKLNSSGVVEYSTYLGGSGIDSAFGVAVDSAGVACVMGVTASTNFPTANPFQPAFGGGTADLFIARIKPDLRISNAMVTGKKLLVLGSGFDQGARILLNGQQQKTINDGQNPTASLVGETAGKKIARGEKVTLQVRNSDGTLSNEFSFTRPFQ